MFGLIDVEDEDKLSLENPIVRISASDVNIDVWGNYNVDEFVEKLLPVKQAQTENLRDIGDPVVFYKQWITYFDHLVSAYQTIDKMSIDLQVELTRRFKVRLDQVSERILVKLLAEPNWLARTVGGYLAAFTQRQAFAESIGMLLMKNPYYADPLCFALVCLDGSEAIRQLRRYLDNYLIIANSRRDERERLSVDWALAGLALLDAKNGTRHSAAYIAPGGLWTQFQDEGFADMFPEEKRPNWQYEHLKSWLKTWDLDEATQGLQTILHYAANLRA